MAWMRRRAAPSATTAPVDTTVVLGSLELPNPIVTASGTYGHGDEVSRHGDPRLRAGGARVMASVWGFSVEEFARATKLLLPARDDLVAVEVNVSCPNVHRRSEMFAHDPESTAAAVAAVRDAGLGLPVFAKLS